MDAGGAGGLLTFGWVPRGWVFSALLYVMSHITVRYTTVGAWYYIIAFMLSIDMYTSEPFFQYPSSLYYYSNNTVQILVRTVRALFVYYAHTTWANTSSQLTAAPQTIRHVAGSLQPAAHRSLSRRARVKVISGSFDASVRQA